MSTPAKKTGGRRTPQKTTGRATASRRATSPKQAKAASSHAELTDQLRELRLPMFREHFASQAERAAAESISHTNYLSELAELECQARRESRIARMMNQSRLPSAKTWDNFKWTRLPLAVARQMESLRDGSFLDRRENLLLFGKPGSGKSHCLCALGEQLIQRGRSVLFTSCTLLVQQLLIAKRDLLLPKTIKKLSRYDALIIDDLGYVQQSREEMEVLFTLLAERYERGSVMLTSNLPFSKWEQIFKDAMTTAAAIDRLVHHSVILELNVPSYRLENAKKPNARKADQPKTKD
jgi:DNA replication protein DnaC